MDLMTDAAVDTASLVRRLRAAGCVFAEEEAAILQDATDDVGELDALCTRRERGEPLEHLVGWVGFGGLRLAVGPGAFIPRQRSLFLAALAAEAAARRADPLLCEAFCGVAPLAAWIRHRMPGVRLLASDLDEISLGYARRNLGEEARIVHGSGLAALPREYEQQIDVLAAVPPYVPESEAEFMPHESRDHEPGGAVFAGVDGLDFIRQTLDEALRWLAPAGVMLLEMNHGQLDTAGRYAEAQGLSVSHFLGEDGQTAVLEARLG
ncbi:hypothetical protein [Arthrobacter sp. NPDC090010]|uniref:hypothetical protein n=1 Tax=Arthrobacter sp. NPDC090010 TaxID=3363942 RepID=UPI0037F3CB25